MDMMGNRVITIGRQYGSNGRTIAMKLAERLGIHYYDSGTAEQMEEYRRQAELRGTPECKAKNCCPDQTHKRSS